MCTLSACRCRFKIDEKNLEKNNQRPSYHQQRQDTNIIIIIKLYVYEYLGANVCTFHLHVFAAGNWLVEMPRKAPPKIPKVQSGAEQSKTVTWRRKNSISKQNGISHTHIQSQSERKRKYPTIRAKAVVAKAMAMAIHLAVYLCEMNMKIDPKMPKIVTFRR